MGTRIAAVMIMAFCILMAGGMAFAAEQAAAETQTQKPAINATPYSGSLWERSTLSGDWDNARNELADKGITFDLSLTQFWQKVVQGGLKTTSEYSSYYNATINLDFEKMGLWKGGFMMVEVEGRYTEESANRNTGALLPVNFSVVFPEAGEKGEQITLPSVLFTQFLCESFGLFGGKIDTASMFDKNEFAHGKGDTKFMNMAFNLNPTLALVAPQYTWGGGGIILPTQNYKDWIVTFGAFKTEGEASTSGIDDIDNGPTSLGVETRLTTDFFDMTGHQLVGYGYSNKSFTSLDTNIRGHFIEGLPISKEDSTWCAYYNFDQYFYEPDKGSGRGAGLFGRFGASDGEANPIHYFTSIGVGGKGICPERPDDRFGIGYYYITAANGDVPRTLGFGDTQGFEAFYNIAMTKWMYLTPDVQVIDPSQRNVDTAVVLGARLQMVF
jgi:porin